MSVSADERWDKRYERNAVSVLAVGFGLVGLDRFIINPLFPVIAEDLGLGYQDLGLIAGILALTWGLASIVAGSLADRFGYKRVLVTSTILFSALVAMSGLATGLVTFLVIRGLMGFAEGGFVPASIVATMRAAKPSRLGLMVGVQQMAAPLVGLGLGPIIAVGLLRLLPSWEWVFATVAIPGFFVAYLLARVIKNPPDASVPPSSSTQRAPRASFASALKYRNVIFGALGMLGFLSALHTLSAFMPSYLTDYAGLSIERMGLVMSALGAGGVIGMLVVTSISDRLGRKPVMTVAMIFAVAALVALTRVTDSPALLALCLFVISMAVSGVVSITIGPLVNASVPPAIAATATGIVAGIGEIVGGAFAPALAGVVAQAQGISVIPYISLIAATFGLLIVIVGVREPRQVDAD
ncbi:MAG: MFS transporter [Pseudomonadota bacterium]